VHRFRLRLARVLGIQIWAHGSWFVVLALSVWAMTVAFGEVLPQLPVAERMVMATVTGSAFFGCLCAHEVAHAVVARRFGVRVQGITLFLLGGVAEIKGELPSPGAEFAVALVGPATSVAIGSALALVAEGAGALGWTTIEVVAFTLALLNLSVALFNLVPGLPLDGGRILRAAIWRRTGSFTRATAAASLGGRVVAASLLAIGIVSAVRGELAGVWYVPMGAFIWFLARASGRATPPDDERALALTGEGEAA
jgi:Zn-dependent protease